MELFEIVKYKELILQHSAYLETPFTPSPHSILTQKSMALCLLPVLEKYLFSQEYQGR